MEQGLQGLEEAYDEGGPNIHPDGNFKFWHIMLMNLWALFSLILLNDLCLLFSLIVLNDLCYTSHSFC